MSNFSDMLGYLRKRDGLSQKELAEKIGVSRSTIGMYEAGDREPNFETLEAIADTFNVNMDTLLGKTRETPILFAENQDSDLVNGDPELTAYLDSLRNRPEMRMLFSHRTAVATRARRRRRDTTAQTTRAAIPIAHTKLPTDSQSGTGAMVDAAGRIGASADGAPPAAGSTGARTAGAVDTSPPPPAWFSPGSRNRLNAAVNETGQHRRNPTTAQSA